MSWICVKAIRRWADEEIESTGRDVLRRQAHKLADDVNETLEEIHTSNDTRHKKLTAIMADTARRNVRTEAEVKRLTDENVELKEKVARLELQLKRVLETKAMLEDDTASR